MRSPSISPVAISTLVSPPLRGACYREASNYGTHSRASSHERSISGAVTKVNTQVTLDSFEVLKLVYGKTPRLLFVCV